MFAGERYRQTLTAMTAVHQPQPAARSLEEISDAQRPSGRQNETNRGGSYWSSADDDALRLGIAEGVHKSDLAISLGRTHKAVTQRAVRLELL